MPSDDALPRHKLYRRHDRGLVAGVAAGIAEHIGVRPAVVRLAFVAFALAGGLGFALYGAYWIVVPEDPISGPRKRFSRLAEVIVAVLLVIAVTSSTISSLPTTRLFGPALLACLGGALIWRQATDTERSRLGRMARSSLSAVAGDRVGRARLAAGVVLVVAGAVSVLIHEDVTEVRDGLLAVIVTIIGLALVTGPWWMRAMTALSDERAERIRSQERADIAAHLHDSVLQTLALIQRNAASPREVTRLARGQERELRTLLYDSPAAAGQLGEALRTTAAEVEDSYAVSVDVVVVGDAALDDGLAAVSAATREALVNAAKHSGTTNVSLYAEVEDHEVNVFVRDKGSGFDPAAVADDRQGVRGSIVGRMQRHGGDADIRSSEAGTEVRIVMPRAARVGQP
ncbi:PspC domain-containing protein [uncultured Jatrophihabitans sp.]|uniref:ATP-binding protein n=1 Tax=uncultured Jatrophihabitans sp. TaxID=1610747 RepID=UPI0035C9F545